jgi:hypothetical protein
MFKERGVKERSKEQREGKEGSRFYTFQTLSGFILQPTCIPSSYYKPVVPIQTHDFPLLHKSTFIDNILGKYGNMNFLLKKYLISFCFF